MKAGRGRNAFRENCERDQRNNWSFQWKHNKGQKCPWTTVPSSLFVDDVIYRLNGNYGTLEDTQAGHKKGGSIQMEFSILSLHCQSHLKIFNWYSSSRSFLLPLRYHHHHLINSSRRSLSKPGHETLLKGFSNEFHAIVTCVAQALEMWDSDYELISIHHSEYMDCWAIAPAIFLSTFHRFSSRFSHFHGSCSAHLVSTMLKECLKRSRWCKCPTDEFEKP